MQLLKQISAALAAATLISGAAMAQETATLNVELNNLEDVDAGCRVTFVAANDIGSDVEKAGFEIAFFNADGLVDRLTTLNFGKLANGRTNVRQFEIPGSKCGGYSRLLINAVKSCDGPADGIQACETALTTSNKSKIEFGA